MLSKNYMDVAREQTREHLKIIRKVIFDSIKKNAKMKNNESFEADYVEFVATNTKEVVARRIYNDSIRINELESKCKYLQILLDQIVNCSI